eukprot:jgi/Tetstr1/455329/TSEL_042164.t1
MPRSNASRKFYAEPMAREALKYIIDHELPTMQFNKRDKGMDVRVQRMISFVDESGALKVWYKKKLSDKAGNTYGRDYTSLPLSIQNLHRPIRNAMLNYYMETSGKRCVDIDIVNCHPVLLLQLIEQHKVQAKYDTIVTYVNDRKGILESAQRDFNCNRDNAKSLLLSLINCGTFQGWAYKNDVEIPEGIEKTPIYDYLVRYGEQFHACMDELMAAMPKMVEVAEESLAVQEKPCTPISLKKRFMHVLITEAEDKILHVMLDYVVTKHKQARVIAKMFDGCIVECEDDIDCELVRRHVVQKTGFVLNFEIKPFVTHIKIPTNLPPIDDKADGNNATLVTRLDFAELLWSRNKDVLGKLKLDGMSQTFYRFAAGVWSEISRNEVNKLFIEAGQNCDEEMGEKACRLWNNFDKIVNLVVNLHCVEDGFSDKLDTSLDIFPFKNCCYDFAIKAFRDIRMGDYVSQTTGYDYTPGQSKDGVRGFLEQVFPVEDERRAFIAIGRYIVTPRKDRKIMPVLTDATDGWNAKTELMKLLNKMVGKLAIQGESAKKMMIKDSSNNKNGHDACMEKLNGKFLNSADEMSGSLQLATHMLKELTSFPMVTGRRFGMSSTFEFRCKALPLFSFNKGQMPMMGQDSVFYDRMLFFHHRSKFIPAATDEEFKKKAKGYEYPFRVDPLIGQKLQGWLSATFDLFVEAGEECMSILNDPPESLIEFRAELTQDDNPMTEFFDAHFEITRNEDDYVQVGEINVYIGKLDDKAVRGLPGSIRFRKNCYETYLKTHGIRVVSRTWVDGEQKRNVAKGVKFKADDCPFIEEPANAVHAPPRVYKGTASYFMRGC